MNELTILYPYGMEVWVKLFNRYWWPGVVVDPLTIPEDLLEYVNKVNPIAVVKFETEDKYEVVLKNDKILLYSCPRKMEFVKKGYSLHKSYIRGVQLSGNFDMQHFTTDVISIERRIGGDIHIFDTIEKAQEQLKTIKQFFTPTKSPVIKKPISKSKKKVCRKSVQELQPSKPKELPSTSQTKSSTPQTKPSKPKELPSTPQTKPSRSRSKPSTPQPKQTPARKRKSSPPLRAVKLHTPIRTTVANGYACHVQANCTYTTNRFDLLKWHMAMHKNDIKEEPVKKLPSSSTNKRKNLKNKLLDVKKIKLEDELLKDWENDGDDEDKELDTNNVPTRIEDVQSTSEVAPTMPDLKPIISEDLFNSSEVLLSKTSDVLPITTSEVIHTTASEVLSTATVEVLSTTKSEVLSPISSEVLPTATSEVLPSISSEVLPTATSEVLPSISSEVLPSISSEVLTTATSEVLPSTSSEVLPSTSSEVLPSTSSEVLPSTSNKVQETIINAPSKILDFNENDNNTPVIEQRQIKSNSSSTIDDISDTFEIQLTSDFIKNTIFETSSKESLLVEEIKEDLSNEPREIYSNEFANEIDDQTKNTELLLEKTVNTLDQISNFESSLIGISNTINNSDSNILTTDDNIIGIPESASEVDSLKEPDGPNEDIYTEADSSIDIVENITVQTENQEIDAEKTVDIEVVPNNVEINQLTDTAIDNSMPIENSCSVYSISNKTNEDKTTAKKDNGERLLKNVEERVWTKDKGWSSGLKEAKLILTLDSDAKYKPALGPLKPIIENNSFEPVFISEETNDQTTPVIFDVQKVLLPYSYTTPTEELRSSAELKALQTAVMNGSMLEIIINHSGDIVSYPEK